MADLTKLGVSDCGDGDDGQDGRRGRRGHRGHLGPTGPTGPSGDGLVGSSIIAFASGLPDSLVHVVGGLADFGAVIGFGSSLDTVFVGDPTLDLTGGFGSALNMAFSMPRDGTLVQLAAFFSIVTEVEAFPAGGSIIAQIYRSSTPDNIFTAVPGALVTIPLPAGVLVVGTHASGTAAFSVPVDAGDRLLLVARVTVIGGTDIDTTVDGYVSAGLAIT